LDHLLHSTDLFKCYWWQNYTTVSNTDLYISYFDLSYVFPGHYDSVQWGLTVPLNNLNGHKEFILWRSHIYLRHVYMYGKIQVWIFAVYSDCTLQISLLTYFMSLITLFFTIWPFFAAYTKKNGLFWRIGYFEKAR
jgi:hypothetical protein